MHPHRKAAAEASREKFRAITGHKGGGHAHAGASHLKRPGAHGEPRVWSGHHKVHLHDGDERAHGRRSKARADKYARGGRAGGGRTPQEEDWYQDTPGGPLGGANAVKEINAGNKPYAGKRTYEPPQCEDWGGSHPASPRKRAAGGRAEARYERDEDELPPPKTASEIGRMSKSDPLYRKIMGKNTGQRSGMTTSDLIGMGGSYKSYGEFGKPKEQSGMSRSDLEGMEDKRGGTVKKKRADGGRVALARGGGLKSKGDKKNVTVNIHLPQQGAGAATPPPAPPPPPPPPPAGGGAPPPGAGAPPPGGAPPGGPQGANPLATLGKGMGFARGGHVKKTTTDKSSTLNNDHDLAHWRDYARKNTETKAERRAFGGRMTAGALSGEGRLEKAAAARRKGK